MRGAAEEPSEGLPGVPDAFQRLWTPHRMAYITGAGKPHDTTPASCPFCVAPTRSDDEGLIVHRGTDAYVVMNLYPYSPGHVLVCPYRHIQDYADLTLAERDEIADLTQSALRTLRAVSAPAGFNVGMNLGRVAGAGIDHHLHQHVVPRWLGDTNFLPIVGQTRALPQLLDDARRSLAEGWK
jgi:ATP adenylyltransferase